MQDCMKKELLGILKDEVVPATGCTEPISIAFAAATAMKYLDEDIDDVQKIEAVVSGNLMKNGMGVMVPGTGVPGLYIAAAVGAAGGDPDGGLEVLRDITSDSVKKAKAMVAKKMVKLTISKDKTHVLFIDLKITGKKNEVKVVTVDDHTNIISIDKNGNNIYEKKQSENDDSEHRKKFLQGLTVQQILEFAEQTPLEELQFIKQAEVLNNELTKQGLTNKYGLKIGYSLSKEIDKGEVLDDLQSHIVMRTVAASDARMGGAPYSAMTNSGSGNQGITATVPVTVVADYVHASEEDRIRALTLSHTMAIYAHSFLPKLSAFCATVTAAIGAVSGMIFLRAKDKKLEKISSGICSMIGGLSGMVCDGAANSCSLKVSMACFAAYEAMMLALNGLKVTGDEGIVSNTAKESLKNVGKLASCGMQQTDNTVLDIMLHKNTIA